MTVNVENVEVEYGTDAGAGLVGDHPGLAEEAEVEPASEEGAKATREEAVDAGVRDSEAGASDVAGELGPVTETYANDGMYVDCSNKTTTYWLETSEILVYPDGTVEFTGVKPNRTETSWPSTPEELTSRGCEAKAEVGTVEVEQASPVQAVELANTGADLSPPVILGAMLVSVIGAWLIANAIANKQNRRDK